MDQVSNFSSRFKALAARLKPFLLENTTDTQTVAKNTVWLSISNFGGRLLKAVVIIYAARVLDPVGWGVVSYAITLAGFFTLFVDPGINVLLMREGSKAEEKHQLNLLSTTFYIKVVLITLVVAFVLMVGPAFTLLPGAKFLLPVTALIIIGDTLREFFSSFIRAKEKMEWEARIFLLTNLFIVILGFIALILFKDSRAFGWAYAAGTTIGALLALWMLRPYLRELFSNFSSKLVFPIMQSAWPFAVTGALGALLTNADILIISWIRTAGEVGIYSAAVRIIQLLYLFPVIIQYSTLPFFARLARKNDGRFREMLERAVIIIFAVSIPIALCGIFLGTAIMKFVFGGAYAAGGASLTLLLVTMIVDYPGGVIGVALFAYDRQRVLINASIIGGVANVLFDLILIPRYGITGSAVATLIAQTLNNAYLWYEMKKVNDFRILHRLKKITAAAAITAIVSGLMIFAHAHIVFIIIVCSILYILLLFAFKEPMIAEIARLTQQENATPENARESAAEKSVAAAAEAQPIIATVRIGTTTIAAEMVRDTEAIRKGLSERDALEPGRGMLFIFPKPKKYRFWMRGMRFPIDIIWIREDKVVGITARIAPEIGATHPRFHYAPRKANYVLEVPAGYAAEKNISVDDAVLFTDTRRDLVVTPAKEETARHAWNHFVAKNHPPIGAFLESWEWGMFQKKLGWDTKRYIVSEKDRIVAVFGLMQYGLPFGFSHGYSPRGPVIAKEDTDEESRHFEILQAIQKWARGHSGAMIFLRLEPSLTTISPDSERYGFRTPSYYIQPRHNTAVHLAAPEEQILARFHPSTRSNINRAVRRGVTVEMKRAMADEDYQTFFAMIESTVKRNGGKNVYPDQHYLRVFLESLPILSEGTVCDPETPALGIFWALQDGVAAAAHIVVFFGGTATYLFGASFAERLSSKAETLLHWSGMREAKRRGANYYDLGGIDEHIWPSLTAFKRQFGGEEFHYIGDIDIPLHPLWYRVYNFSKKTLKRMRHQG
jgi:PST family polysaccharide transporter